MIKTDLHMRGSLEFRKNKPVLDLILKQCLSKEIEICAITSEGYADDNFGRLKSEVSGKYDVRGLGDNVLAFNLEKKKVYLVNSQISEFKDEEVLLYHLMVGRNKLNFTSLDAALGFGSRRGLAQIAVEPKVVDRKRAHALTKYDCIEGYSAERCLPVPINIPDLGKLGGLSKEWNEACLEIGISYGLNRIATSGARSIKRIGNGFVSLDEKKIDYSNQDNFLGSLKHCLKEGFFVNYESGSSSLDVLLTHFRL